MRSAHFLSWLENLALWVLWRSPRVGFIAVKQMNTDVTWYCQSPCDVSIEFELFEPPSMELERLYHMPSYGENE